MLERGPRTTGWRHDRDAWETALLDAAEEVGLPTLGICRGMQVMAAAFADDGTLEAMERPGERFCVAVQWHPEMAADAGLFRALVRAAADR